MSLEPFICVRGVAARLMQNNIDTDQITPGHVGMKVATSGFGEGLFFNWRYNSDGTENSDFILNQQPFRDAKFLIAGVNFGCGSSREFAVFALRDFGFRAIIAPSFGAIFTSNCYMNGIAPIILAEEDVVALAEEISSDCATMTIDMKACEIHSPKGKVFTFHIPALQRERMLLGLDAISQTLKRDSEITDFQAADAKRRPWVYEVTGL